MTYSVAFCVNYCVSSRDPFIRARQRSGEGVVWRNGCPKGCFRRVRFFSAPSRFALKTPEMSWKPLIKGAEKKRTLQKHPFGQPFLHTIPSPLLWRVMILLWPQYSSYKLSQVFPHLPAANKVLRSRRVKLIESDWKRLRMTERDWKWLKSET